MMRANRLVIAAIALSLVQIGFLSWMIVGRAAILRNGAEVLLRIQPVDPRDLLRGDYVQLGYAISSLDASLFSQADREAGATGDAPVHVRLRRQDDGYWTAVAASFAPPSADAGEDVDLRGVASYGAALKDGGTVRVEYGIERFYLPEGEGRAIERDMATRSFGIRAAVAGDGQAQIKALLDGGEVVFSEPLY